MDFLHSQTLVALSFFLILLSSSSLLPIKADDYFINCGSSSTFTTSDGRNFAGDTTNPSPPNVKLFSTGKTAVKTTENQPDLYQTAIVFSSPAAYQFNVIETGTYILRLHFLAFSSSSSLTNSRFNVSASGYTLLADFKPNRDSAVVKEFILEINPGKFNLYFVPCSSSVVAFVNAIELFLTPLKANTDSAVVVSAGIGTDLVSRVLHPVYRINFGGQTVPSSNDRLWRTWISDDPFLQSKISAKNGSIHISRPNYFGGNATDYDAPDAVYNTAKELNESLIDLGKFVNATWSFNVSRRSSSYFVRAHFCDIVSAALGAIVFDLRVSSRVVWKVDPYEATPNLAAPFYLDFLVKPDELGFVNISIAPRKDTRITENAFINGLEIMEVLSDEVVEPRVGERWLSKRGVVVVIGLVACVVVLTYLLATRVIKGIPVEAFSHWKLVDVDEEGNSESKLSEKNAPNSFATSKFIRC